MTRLCACLALVSVAGCIKAPEIVLVDRATALEQQAAGSFKELEERLVRTAIAARPVPLTPAELHALGEVLAPFHGEVAGRRGSYSATLSFEEADLDVVSALSLALEIFRDQTFDVGLPDWPVVRAVVTTFDDQ